MEGAYSSVLGGMPRITHGDSPYNASSDLKDRGTFYRI